MSRRWWIWPVAGLSALGAWALVGGQRAAPTLANQVWLERLPQSPRDLIWHFVAVDRRGQHQGALGQSSRWRVVVDGFVWSAEGTRIRLHTPQNDCRITLEARTWVCDDHQPFELCLELRGGGKIYRYYSRRDWVIKDAGQLPEELAWLTLPAPAATGNDEAAAEAAAAAAPECPAPLLGP